MKKLLKLGFLFAFFIGVATTAMADIVTTFSGNIDFSVNDSGSFYVKSSQIPGAISPPGLNASSSISGSNFHLTATAISPNYSDAGIVLFFNGGLKLGDLQSVSVVSTGDPVAINLWLDTGGDGHFFAFNGTGVLTGLNGDSYGSFGSGSVSPNSSLQMFSGVGAGHTYTLAQLQTGSVLGINSNTPVSLWIGITNGGIGSADISGIAVSTLDTSVTSVPTSNGNLTSTFPNGVITTFQNVISPGNTNLIIQTTPTHTPPLNFRFLRGGYFDISTTCTYSGNITITVPYDPTDASGNENNLKLFHWKNNGWEDCTVSVDTVHKTITGQVNSLSPFGIGSAISFGAYSAGANTNIIALLAILAISIGVFLIRRRRTQTI